MLTAELTPQRHRRGTPGFRRVNLALFAAGLTTFTSLYSTQALLPVLARSFAVSPTVASLLVSLATGMLALAIVPMSSLSERFGRVRIMVVSAFAAAMLGLVAPLCPSFATLAAVRAAQGVALAGVPAVAMAYLAEEVDRAALGGAMGMYIAGNTMGGLLGRLIPGLTTEVAGWRWALGASAVVALGFTLLFWRLLPQSRNFAPMPISAAAIGGHLRDPGLRRLYLIALVLMGGFVTVYNFLGFRLLAAPFRLPQTVVGLVFLMYLAGIVSSPVAGRLADRIGRRPVLVGAIVVAAIGLLLTLPDVVPLIGAGLLLFTAGFFAAHSVASGWVGLLASSARAQASALYLFSYYVGSSVGGSLGGLAFEHQGWPGIGGYVLVLLTIGLLATTGRSLLFRLR